MSTRPAGLGRRRSGPRWPERPRVSASLSVLILPSRQDVCDKADRATVHGAVASGAFPVLASRHPSGPEVGSPARTRGGHGPRPPARAPKAEWAWSAGASRHLALTAGRGSAPCPPRPLPVGVTDNYPHHIHASASGVLSHHTDCAEEFVPGLGRGKRFDLHGEFCAKRTPGSRAGARPHGTETAFSAIIPGAPGPWVTARASRRRR